ncbi:3-isopropylmalate dehydratase small subunit [Buchnera aphidicola]|uniref:3-isopropylmalate dehydratase small subunit n=1 Tax=Buchnera aphidicola TaxID=9 RepID=UPI0030EBC543
MKKFKIHIGTIVPIIIDNIDTDVLIPKQFLKVTHKKNFGKNLFYSWRFLDKKGKIKNKKFILNLKNYKKSTILIAGKNFGCGSSREHAVWALQDFGFKVIISEKFSDIFYNNSINNNLLLITLKKKVIKKILKKIIKNPKVLCKINLKKNHIQIKKKNYIFKLDKFYRFKLLNGLDQIEITLQNEKQILKYEKKNFNTFLLKNRNLYC